MYVCAPLYLVLQLKNIVQHIWHRVGLEWIKVLIFFWNVSHTFLITNQNSTTKKNFYHSMYVFWLRFKFTVWEFAGEFIFMWIQYGRPFLSIQINRSADIAYGRIKNSGIQFGMISSIYFREYYYTLTVMLSPFWDK